jgi:hypothetical protein
MDRKNFVGQKVMPPLPVYESGGTYGIIPLEALLKNGETIRNADGSYRRDDWDFDTNKFATQERGVEQRVDDNASAMFANYFDMERIATGRAMDRIARAQEIRISKLYFNTSNFANTGVSTPWSTGSSATPIEDVKAGKKAFWQQCGLWPNAGLCERHLFMELQNCDEIVDRVKFQGFQDARPGNITAQAIAQALDLPQLIVAGGAQNTANPAQARSLSEIWSPNYFMLLLLPEGEDPVEPCTGRLFHWDESRQEYGDLATEGGSGPLPVVETYRDEPKRSDIVRVRHQVEEVIYYPEAGYLLTDVYADTP